MKTDKNISSVYLFFFGSIIICYLLTVYYCFRYYYKTFYDIPYWKEKYEQSQWILPLSPRTIGDDGLYMVEGFRIVNGADPTEKNAEMPPIGKYAIGLSVKFLNNGPIFGFIVMTFLIFVFGFFVYELTGNKLISLAGTALLATDPLVTDQFRFTMLDGLQTLFALTAFYTLFKFTKSKNGRRRLFLLLLIGLTSGLYLGTKTPILGGFLIITIAITLYHKSKSVLYPAFFIFISGFTYLMGYLKLLFDGKSIIDILKIQAWIVSFYRQSLLTPNYLSASTTLFSGKLFNLFSKNITNSDYFTLMWPIITVTVIIVSYMTLRKKINNPTLKPVLIYVISLFTVFNFIPFWTRYLLMILPFMYLVFIALFYNQKFFTVLAITGIIFNIFSSFTILFPGPENTVKELVQAWNFGYFEDIYELLDNKSKSSITRKDFSEFGKNTLYNGQIEYAYITVEKFNFSDFDNAVFIPLKVTYYTRYLGPYHHNITIPLIREDGVFKVKWMWNYYLPDLNKNTTLATEIDRAKRGAIIFHETPIAEDMPGFEINVIPDKINTIYETQMLDLISRMFDNRISKIAIHQRYNGYSIRSQAIPIGTPPVKQNDPKWDEIRKYESILLLPSLARISKDIGTVKTGDVRNSFFIECCSFLYNTTNYVGSAGVEEKYNTELKGINGGKLILYDTNGNIKKVLLSIEKKDGLNISL